MLERNREARGGPWGKEEEADLASRPLKAPVRMSICVVQKRVHREVHWIDIGAKGIMLAGVGIDPFGGGTRVEAGRPAKFLFLAR